MFFAVKLHSDSTVSLQVAAENYCETYCVIQSVEDILLAHTTRNIYFYFFIPTCAVLVSLKLEVLLNYK